MRFGRSKLPLRVVSQIFSPSFSSDNGGSSYGRPGFNASTRWLEHGPVRKGTHSQESRKGSVKFIKDFPPTKISIHF